MFPGPGIQTGCADIIFKPGGFFFYVFPVGTDMSGRAAHTLVIAATTSVEDSCPRRKVPWLVSIHSKIISCLLVKLILTHV